ncbi:hypothetical protein ACFQUU_16755 [Herbaspirillum sp. GCM10030257]
MVLAYAILTLLLMSHPMRHFFSSFCRLIAGVLLMTVFTSGIAMATYVCPELAQPAMTGMTEGMPCADMDKEKPVHCAEFQARDDLALEHLAAPLAVTPPTILLVMPAMAPAIPPFLTVFWPDSPSDPGSDPPYLRTQRLRI